MKTHLLEIISAIRSGTDKHPIRDDKVAYRRLVQRIGGLSASQEISAEDIVRVATDVMNDQPVDPLPPPG